MKNYKVKMLVEAALVIAMMQVLGMIILYQMPQGGAVKAANLVPLLIYSYRWGGRAGILAGMGYGILHFLLGLKFSVHYMSVILDYILAYGAVGVAGLWMGRTKISVLFSSSISIALKILASVISGATVFASYAPAGQNVWIYSLLYNMTYALPDGIVNIVIAVLLANTLLKGIEKSSKSQRQ